MIIDLRERRARKILKEDFGVTQPLLTRLWPTLWVSLIVVIAVILQLHDYAYPNSRELVKVAIPLATIGAVVLALQQFKQQRNEFTIAGSLNRLDIVNSYYRNADKVQILVVFFSKVPWAGDDITDNVKWQQRMYVFLEIDNLQYGLERFRLGHSSAYQALRTLDLFCARCQSEKFLEVARKLVADNSGSYTLETRQVVGKLTSGRRPLAEAEIGRRNKYAVEHWINSFKNIFKFS